MFAGARFTGPADFTLARFQGDAIFAQGCALQATLFDRSTFAGSADFGASFFDAAPGMAQSASFTDAVFHGRADFSTTAFSGGATFDRARFEQGASFQGAVLGRFHGAKRDPRGKIKPLYSFVDTTASGSLDFSFATFQTSTTLENVNASGVVSFKEATFNPTCTFIDDAGNTVSTSRCIAIDSLSAGALRMDVASVLHTVKAPQQPAILDLIESSAKARGDLAQANDAHYERQILNSRKDNEPERILDVVFYRTIAGYFVRPLNPLLCLLALAGIIALVRTGWRTKRGASNNDPSNAAGGEVAKRAQTGTPAEARAAPARRLVRLLHRVTHAVASFTVQLMSTLSLIGRRGADSDETPWKRIEIYAYRILVVLVLIGFANSNPTLRQMLDALL